MIKFEARDDLNRAYVWSKTFVYSCYSILGRNSNTGAHEKLNTENIPYKPHTTPKQSRNPKAIYFLRHELFSLSENCTQNEGRKSCQNTHHLVILLKKIWENTIMLSTGSVHLNCSYSLIWFFMVSQHNSKSFEFCIFFSIKRDENKDLFVMN